MKTLALLSFVTCLPFLEVQPYYLTGANLGFQVHLQTISPPRNTTDYVIGIVASGSSSCPIANTYAFLSSGSSATLYAGVRRMLLTNPGLAVGTYDAKLYARVSVATDTTVTCQSMMLHLLDTTPMVITASNAPLAGGAGYAAFFDRTNTYPGDAADTQYFEAQTTLAKVPWTDFRRYAYYHSDDICGLAPFATQLNGGFTMEAWFHHNAAENDPSCCSDLISLIDTRTLPPGTTPGNVEILMGAISGGVSQIAFPSTSFETEQCNAAAFNMVALPIRDGQWHHVAAVYEASTGTKRMFVDGVERFTRTGCFVRSSTPSVISGSTVRVGNSFQGFIDEVRVFNFPKTAAQIRASMLRSLRWDEIDATVLVYYNFDELYYTDRTKVSMMGPTLYTRETRAKQLVLPDLSRYGQHIRLGQNKLKQVTLTTHFAYQRLVPDFRPSSAPIVGSFAVAGNFKAIPADTDPTRSQFLPNGILQNLKQTTLFSFNGYQPTSIHSIDFSAGKNSIYTLLSASIQSIRVHSIPSGNAEFRMGSTAIQPITYPKSTNPPGALSTQTMSLSDISSLLSSNATLSYTSAGTYTIWYSVIDSNNVESPRAPIHFQVHPNSAPVLGNAGNMMYCDGNQYAYAPNFTLPKRNSALTVEFWQLSYASRAGRKNTVYAFNSEGEGNANCPDTTDPFCGGRFLFHLDINDDNTQSVYTWASMKAGDTTGTALFDAGSAIGTWNHWAIVQDEVHLRVYLNGNLVSTNPAAPQLADMYGFYLCHWPFFSENYHFYVGYIDEFRFWNVARTQSEIRESMFRRISGSHPNLMAYYDFDEIGYSTTNMTATNLEAFDIKSPSKDVYLQDLSARKAHMILGGCTVAKRPFCKHDGDDCVPHQVPTQACVVNQNHSLTVQIIQGFFLLMKVDGHPAPT
jgi:hypothetical protein